MQRPLRCPPVCCNSRAFDEEPAVGDFEAFAVVAVRRGRQLDDLNGPAVRRTVPITYTVIMPQVRRSFAPYGQAGGRPAVRPTSRNRSASATTKSSGAPPGRRSAALIRDSTSACLCVNSRAEIQVFSCSVTQRLMSCIPECFCASVTQCFRAFSERLLIRSCTLYRGGARKGERTDAPYK